MAQWHVRQLDGSSAGPYSNEQVLDLLHRGGVTGATQVCPVGHQDWQPLAAWPELAEPTSGPAAMSTGDRLATGFVRYVLGVPVAILVVWYAFNSVFGDDDDERPFVSMAEQEDKARDDAASWAWVMTQGFVEEQLKSPSTAEFSHLLRGEIQTSDNTVTVLKPGSIVPGKGDDKILGTSDDVLQSVGGQYSVRGWVDSQNSFGAVIRSNFSARVESLPDEQWRLLELNMN
jgi:hypothetical protein